jgi:hypothetical protein
VSFAVITLCVASQRVFVVVSVYFVMDSIRKLLDTYSYLHALNKSLIQMCDVSNKQLHYFSTASSKRNLDGERQL